MRKGLFVAVVLAWTTAGFGMDMALMGGPIDFNWETDTSLSFDLYVISDTPFAGLQWTVLFEEEAQNNLWTVTNVDDTGNTSGLTHSFNIFEVFTGASLQEIADNHYEVTDQWSRDDIFTPAGTYFLARVTIKPMVSMEPYQGESFTLAIPLRHNVSDVYGDPIGTAMPLVINIVPEPCGILSLVAAVPFMRRRKG